jgi:hypothetical protein
MILLGANIRGKKPLLANLLAGLALGNLLCFATATHSLCEAEETSAAQAGQGVSLSSAQSSAAADLSAASVPTQDQVAISDSYVEFPPLTRDSIDYLFDSLRSGSLYDAPQPFSSQVVSPNIAGIWAGTKFSLDSDFGVITLRFKPTDQDRLDRAAAGSKLPALTDSFDVELEFSGGKFQIRHLAAENKLARAGLAVKISEGKANRPLIEFVKGFGDSGAYFAWPPVSRQQFDKTWSLLICPRRPVYVRESGDKYIRLELLRSPYELRDIYFSMSSSVSASMSPGEKAERMSVKLLPTANLPRTTANQDEVVSLAPRIHMPYRPVSEFKFFRLPPLSGQVVEGIWAKIETQNPAGYIRRQYQSHVLYVHKFDEPSPVPVIIGDYRAARDVGACYIISSQRAVWNEYDRKRQD